MAPRKKSASRPVAPPRISLSLDPQALAILDATADNASRYVSALIMEHWRQWQDAWGALEHKPTCADLTALAGTSLRAADMPKKCLRAVVAWEFWAQNKALRTLMDASCEPPPSGRKKASP